MYLAYKYAKKRYQQRQEEKAAAAAQAASAAPVPYAQGYGVQSDVVRSDLNASPDHGTSSSNEPFNPSAVSAEPKTTEPKSKETETPEEIAEKKRRRRYRFKIILGLFLPFTLQALDTTIIASALKFIADDFRQFCPPPTPSLPHSYMNPSAAPPPPC
jgi:hypothetical protein